VSAGCDEVRIINTDRRLWCFRLNDEILACSAWISPTFEEHEAREMMISKVRRIIKNVERDAQVYAFGSHETKLYLPGG
jgi:non-canonical poly(A) RNA polymerase PAPD5/7